MFKESANRGATPVSAKRRPSNNPPPKQKDPVRKGATAPLDQSALEAYLAHHWHSAKSSLMRLLQSPLSSLLTWMVIAVALALPVGLAVMLNNAAGLTDNLEGTARMTLFMELAQEDAQSHQLAQQIESRAEVDTVEFISREQALQEFSEAAGWDDVLSALDENPLPSVIVVQPSADLDDAGQISGLMNEFEALAGVDSVQLDLQWVKRLHALFVLFERILLALGALFAVAVVLIIGNTLRLSIENRREEIVVTKLVGATDPFVRRPFLYTGFWYGTLGALLAWIVVSMGLSWLAIPVAEVANLYYSDFRLQGLSVSMVLALLASGGVLGSAGAWLAVKRHLDDIEPA